MKKIIFSSLFLISLMLISGCEVTQITPENVNPIATEIQQKYDQISSYQADIYSIDKGEIRFGLYAAIKPNQYKKIIHWEGNRFLPIVEFCKNNKRSTFTSDTKKIVTEEADCSLEVSAFFNVFDEIKKLANYKNTVKEIEISKEDYKEVSYLAPTALTEDNRNSFNIIATSDNGYTFAERLLGNVKIPGGLGDDGIEIWFTDEKGNNVRLVFIKSNYQLIKSEITYPNGQTEIRYYTNMILNDMNIVMDIPSEESLNRLYK